MLYVFEKKFFCIKKKKDYLLYILFILIEILNIVVIKVLYWKKVNVMIKWYVI